MPAASDIKTRPANQTPKLASYDFIELCIVEKEEIAPEIAIISWKHYTSIVPGSESP